MDKRVRCNQCGHTDKQSEFPHGRDFFQNRYVSRCPKCDNRQSPGNASIRMFGGDRPFSFVDSAEPSDDPLKETLRRADEAS